MITAISMAIAESVRMRALNGSPRRCGSGLFLPRAKFVRHRRLPLAVI
jgi:hypothetical protein